MCIVVAECRKILLAAGFTELLERNAWDTKPNGKVRELNPAGIPNQSAVVF